MSVPGQDEQPQTFETIEQIAAHRRPERAAGLRAAGVLRGFPAGLRPAVLFAARDAGGRRRAGGVRPRCDRGEEGRGATREPGWRALAFDPPVQSARLWPGAARAAKAAAPPALLRPQRAATANVYVPANPPTVLWPKWIEKPVVGAFRATRTALSAGRPHRRPKPRRPAPRRCRPRPGSAAAHGRGRGPPTSGTPSSAPLEDSVTHPTCARPFAARPAVAPLPVGGHLVAARSGTGAAQLLEQDAVGRAAGVVTGRRGIHRLDVALTVTSTLRFGPCLRRAQPAAICARGDSSAPGVLGRPWRDPDQRAGAPADGLHPARVRARRGCRVLVRSTPPVGARRAGWRSAG